LLKKHGTVTDTETHSVGLYCNGGGTHPVSNIGLAGRYRL